MQYHNTAKLNRGDFVIFKDHAFVITDVYDNMFRVFNGNTYMFISPQEMSGSTIATKRGQDPKLSKLSINKNSYYVSTNPGEYPESYKVKIILNKNTGQTKVIPENTEMKPHYQDVTSEFKKNKNIDESSSLYAFKDKNGIVVKNAEFTTPVYDASNNFEKIFDKILPGSFVKLGIDTKDLKYWLVEKRVGDSYLISHSFYREGEIRTVKKLLNSYDNISDLRLPSYATNTIKDINDIIGTKSSMDLTREKGLMEYDSPEVISQMIVLLKDKYGITVNPIHSSELLQFGDIENVGTLRAFVRNGEYYVNVDNASISDPLHEFLHMFLASMKASDYEGYRNIVDSVQDHPLFSEVAREYKETNSDLLEETFVRLLSQTVRHEINERGIFSEEVFDNAMKTAIKDVFSLKNDLKDENYISLMDSTTKDVLSKFESRLIDFSDTFFDKTNAESMIKISSKLRELLKDGKLKEQCNG